MALRGSDLVYFLNFEMVYFIIFQNYLIKKLIIMWNLNYLCSMWLMFELFDPMMKVKNEIWDIIHKKIKN